MSTLSIVLPCHNEAEALPAFLPRLKSLAETLAEEGVATDFVVIDDGSTDESYEIAKAHDFLRVYRQDTCQGYGHALKRGFELAKGDYILFMDCDNTYFPEDIPLLLNTLVHYKMDIVSGCRPFFGSGMPLIRALGNLLFVFVARLLFGRPVRDCSTGFRIFHRSLLPQVLGLADSGFNFSMHLTLMTLVSKWRWQQVDVRYQYRLGKSKLSVIKDGTEYLWMMFKFRWRTLTSATS